MSERLSGKCLCGAVRFAATPKSDEMGVYRSSDYGERVFCRTCGSSLFWRMQDGSHLVASLQAFDEPSGFRFTSEIFVDEKPALYAFANDTKQMTGSEFIASMTGEGA